MDILIPYRFYGFDSLMYLVSAIVGFFVSFYAYKLYDITAKKQHFYFYIGFTILSMAFLTLSVSTGYSYLTYFRNRPASLLDTVIAVDDFGYWIYYIASLVAYGFMVLAYKPEKSSILPIFFLPAWYRGFPYFNILSFFLISYVAFRNVINYNMKKNMNTLLVMLAFILIGGYHLLLFFNFLGKIVYVLAHLSLLAGFASLLIMLTRVSRK